MQAFLGMLLGAVLVIFGVYLHDTIQTSDAAGSDRSQAARTIVNWDVAKSEWHALKARAHEDWVRVSSK